MLEKTEHSITNITGVAIEPSNDYTRTVYAFSGADMTIFIDGIALGEASGIVWEKDLTGGRTWPIKGTLTCTMFDKEPLDIQDKGYYVMVQYCDEYGNAAQEEFHDVNFHRMHGGMYVDDIVPEVKYDFTASRRVYKPNMELEDLRNERVKAQNR
jgi:hypothetical protein